MKAVIVNLSCLGAEETKYLSGQSAMNRPTVLLADDNPSVIEGVRVVLADKCEVVATVCDGEGALAEAQRLRPDVLVLDISMGKLSGIEVARRLRASGSFCRIVFLTVQDDPEFVQAAIGAGGLAYVVKACVETDLLSAIHAVMTGKMFLSPMLVDQSP
ncbi:MAG TPA: response regulator transcription factor [Terriglobales bacterium]